MVTAIVLLHVERKSINQIAGIISNFEGVSEVLPPEKDGPIRQHKRTHLKVACIKERAYLNPSTVDV